MTFGMRILFRSTCRWLLPLLAAAQLLVMWNVQGSEETSLPGWSLDWSWMLSVWDGGTLLLSPVAAAAVVLLAQRTWKDDARELVAALPRAVFSRLDMVVAVVVQAWLVQGISLAVAALMCWGKHADSSGLTLPWQLLTGPCAVLAAAALGGLVGECWKGPWAVPVTAVAVFLWQRVFFWMGCPELLTTEMATGPMVGARPIPRQLLATVLANLFFAAGCLSLMAWKVRVRGFRHRRLLVVGPFCLLAVVAIFWPFVAAHALDTYEVR